MRVTMATKTKVTVLDDPRVRRLRERWRKALPTCQDCGRVCFYLLHSDVWVCREHGQQWTGAALAFSRGYRPCP